MTDSGVCTSCGGSGWLYTSGWDDEGFPCPACTKRDELPMAEPPFAGEGPRMSADVRQIPPALRIIGRVRTMDTELVLQLRCPECGRWGDIDDDQLHGFVSVDHSDMPGCTYHVTEDFARTAFWLETDTSRRCGWGPWSAARKAAEK